MKTTIVSVADLAAHPEWRVFDCSFALAGPEVGPAAYAEGHIPGALHAPMETALSGGRTGSNGRNPLPDPQVFAGWLGSVGLRPGDQVVCYDRAGNPAAARLWWMLRWVGHDAVAVLDGGMAAWTGAGHPLTQEVPEVAATVYPVLSASGAHVDLAFVEASLADDRIVTVDARGAEKYHGINETMDPRGGHIPGALHRSYAENTDAAGLFKPAETLRQEWRALLGDRPPEQVIASCGSGVSACHNLLAMQIAGLPGARLYAGSWSEWCADPARPIET